MASIYRVGLGSAVDGTWKKGGRNVTKHGHIVVQRLIIDGETMTKEDVPEPEKGEMGFNRDTFLYIPEEVSSTASVTFGNIVEGANMDNFLPSLPDSNDHVHMGEHTANRNHHGAQPMP